MNPKILCLEIFIQVILKKVFSLIKLNSTSLFKYYLSVNQNYYYYCYYY